MNEWEMNVNNTQQFDVEFYCMNVLKSFQFSMNLKKVLSNFSQLIIVPPFVLFKNALR